MVDAKKHKAKQELIQDLEVNVIEVINSNPNAVLKELSVNLNEFKHLLKVMKSKEGSVIDSIQCKLIIDYAFKMEFILETINLNYHAFKLDADIISEVKKLASDILETIQELKKLQNNNIDNGKYLGLESVIAVELANNSVNKPVEYYFSEEFENLLRINYNYK